MYYNGTDEHMTKRGGYENETFLINPYYWGDEEGIIEEPNFIYKPEDIKIWWYKYPFRSSYINKNIQFYDFVDILNRCKESMQ